ncbi:dihydroneopterin aldolase [Anaerobacillus arseniciselenatis]|uniref:7,8-dihydroneopterin aldolase n=1 Tax=Anaerobacillus arseniciselenatis TaxID=85682 RepID=A0A1S2LPJ7_9BACI|nr:dihydroneopterin aldolase [Anaerobacillus arseniciselenatis]OIJ14439.1 dihydroneopterin aldolase [Anaerobacillus arseniciselenatis]
MDKIFLNQMEFYGYHGVFPEETKLGQRFIVDVVLEVDLKEAGKTDDLTKTINYAEVYDIVKSFVEGPPFKLIEALSEKIVENILNQFPQVHNCTLKLVKPNPPIAGHYHSVAVEIKRGQNG